MAESIKEPEDRCGESQRREECYKEEDSGEPVQENNSQTGDIVPEKEENKPDSEHSVPETEESGPDSGENDTESVKKETDGKERFLKETLSLAGNALRNLQREMEVKAYRAALASAKSLVNYLEMVADGGD